MRHLTQYLYHGAADCARDIQVQITADEIARYSKRPQRMITVLHWRYVLKFSLADPTNQGIKLCTAVQKIYMPRQKAPQANLGAVTGSWCQNTSSSHTTRFYTG